MTELVIVRHGDYHKVDEENRFEDRGLTDEGQQQAERLRDRLNDGEFTVDTLIASTLPRAQETARIIAPALKVEIASDPALVEWKRVDNRVTADEFDARLKTIRPDQRASTRFYPGGETWTEFMHRATTALDTIIQQHAGKTIMLVVHGGILKASFQLFCGFSALTMQPIIVNVRHASITHWKNLRDEVGEFRWMLIGYNDTAHLR